MTALGRERIVALVYGACCHIVFVLGVGTMMVAMAFGMSRCWGRLPSPWGGIADGLLLLQFPLAHSFLLSRRGRKVLSRMAPLGLGGKLSTTTYAAIASVQVGLLFLLWTPSGIVWWRAEGPWLAATLVLYAAAWLLLLKSIVDAGFPLQVGLLGWLAVFRARKPVYPPMPRRGLFRLCRQPIYVAFALTTLDRAAGGRPTSSCVASVLTLYCVLGPAVQGGQVPAGLRRRVRRLPPPRALLAALAAPGGAAP